ncbi:MAG: indolepyruvate oxidoreductase subunit beta [Coriobacteriales bacterium]
MENKIVLLVGVGGQGTILAGDLLAKTAAASGYDVKISEIHGMSQRGGSVQTVVSMGHEVHTMIADEGCADVIVSFEAVEALRNQQFLAKGGALFVNDEQIVPVPVNIGNAVMPQRVGERLEELGAVLIPAGAIAREAGSPKSTNVVLMGALSTALPFAQEVWEDVIAQRVPPKTVEANLAAFKAGRAAAGA